MKEEAPAIAGALVPEMVFLNPSVYVKAVHFTVIEDDMTLIF